MKRKPVYVNQPALPPLEEFIPYLQSIWERKVLTNNGPMHQELEKALCDYLDVEHISLFNNGTSALLTAVQALSITGEVITTPYSFVATANALIWNSVKPVFVDIDPSTFNLDPTMIEAAITPSTTAIMPVHCYGRPCNYKAIQDIADQHGLKVIYDAAHAFGVRDQNGSILRHGDLSILSFHATKVFNTFEGGAIISPNAEMKARIDQLKNFGFIDEETLLEPGINGKMSEINAAFGLLQLKYVAQAIDKRNAIDAYYRKELAHVKGLEIPQHLQGTTPNFSYFPIIINMLYPLTRDELYSKLNSKNIFPRRYFFPIISNFKAYKKIAPSTQSSLVIANKASLEVLCLPIYPSLEQGDIEKIISILQEH